MSIKQTGNPSPKQSTTTSKTSKPNPVRKTTVTKKEQGKVVSRRTTYNAKIDPDRVNPRQTKEGRNKDAAERKASRKKGKYRPNDDAGHPVSKEMADGAKTSPQGKHANRAGTWRKQENAVVKTGKKTPNASVKAQEVRTERFGTKKTDRPLYRKLILNDGERKTVTNKKLGGDNVLYGNFVENRQGPVKTKPQSQAEILAAKRKALQQNKSHLRVASTRTKNRARGTQ